MSDMHQPPAQGPEYGEHDASGPGGTPWYGGPNGAWPPGPDPRRQQTAFWPPAGGYWPQPEPPRRPRRHIRALVAGAIGAAVLVGVGIGHVAWQPSAASSSSDASSNGFGGGSAFGNQFQPSGGNGGAASGASDGSSPASAVASKVDPGLVDVDTTLGYQSEEAAGTGIVLTSDGEILTNNHVINGATSIRVTDLGNNRTYAATVVGYDETDDVAVLRLVGASHLPTATLGTSITPKVNQNVVAIGNAGGVGGTPSTAAGRITALNQSITANDENDSSSENLTGLLQVNADVEPGDSGGPLVTEQGQVIGMDTAASAGFTFRSSGQSSGHQGFAIPINHAMSIVHRITAGQESTTVHIGATGFLGVEVSSAATGQGGTPSGGTPRGAIVAGLIPDSPAASTQLSENDVITSLDGTAVTSSQSLTKLLSHHHPNDPVALTWVDTAGQQHTATIRLANGPAA